jgi:glycosyltransferase involved in cell wall biosynthesis
MSKPLISIALCTYNGEKFLSEQLDSLVQQDYPNLEIIITDDCSSDQTPLILQDFSSRYPFITVYYNEENLGYIKNFEKALRLCKGEFVALSDQDDIWSLNKISAMVDQIGENMLIYHDSEFIDDSGKSMNKKMSDIINMYSGNNFRPFLLFNCVSGHACLFKQELLNSCLPFPKGVFHDRWLAFTATNLGSIAYLDLPLVKYRQHENSDTNILKIKRVKKTNNIEGRQRIIQTFAEIEILLTFKFIKDRAFIEKLLQLQRNRLDEYFCPKLVVFMLKNYKMILYILNKSALSKLNLVRKHFLGGKLKKI